MPLRMRLTQLASWQTTGIEGAVQYFIDQGYIEVEDE